MGEATLNWEKISISAQIKEACHSPEAGPNGNLFHAQFHQEAVQLWCHDGKYGTYTEKRRLWVFRKLHAVCTLQWVEVEVVQKHPYHENASQPRMAESPLQFTDFKCIM